MLRNAGLSQKLFRTEIILYRDMLPKLFDQSFIQPCFLTDPFKEIDLPDAYGKAFQPGLFQSLSGSG